MRKVIQLSLALYQGAGCIALCDDGSMWWNERPYDSHGKTENCGWLRVRDIPQDEDLSNQNRNSVSEGKE